MRGTWFCFRSEETRHVARLFCAMYSIGTVFALVGMSMCSLWLNSVGIWLVGSAIILSALYAQRTCLIILLAMGFTALLVFFFDDYCSFGGRDEITDGDGPSP